MNIQDIRFDSFTNNSPVTVMTLTHEPTGITVKGEGESRFRLKEELLSDLATLLRVSGAQRVEY